jgi:hypothetical protein
MVKLKKYPFLGAVGFLEIETSTMQNTLREGGPPLDKIPTSLIGLLSRVIPARYTASQIDSLFLSAGAPEAVPEGSKQTKVQNWLRKINLESAEPLRILGKIVDDFMVNVIASNPSMQPTRVNWTIAFDFHPLIGRVGLGHSDLPFAAAPRE